MRDRHFPRLCRSCDAPMSRQEDSCWHCGAVWDYPAERRHALRVIRGGDAGSPAGSRQSPEPEAVGHEARAVAQAQQDSDRWTDEGGSVAAEESRVAGARAASRDHL